MKSYCFSVLNSVFFRLSWLFEIGSSFLCWILLLQLLNYMSQSCTYKNKRHSSYGRLTLVAKKSNSLKLSSFFMGHKPWKMWSKWSWHPATLTYFTWVKNQGWFSDLIIASSYTYMDFMNLQQIYLSRKSLKYHLAFFTNILHCSQICNLQKFLSFICTVTAFFC